MMMRALVAGEPQSDNMMAIKAGYLGLSVSRSPPAMLYVQCDIIKRY